MATYNRPISRVETLVVLTISSIFCIFFLTNRDIEWRSYVSYTSEVPIMAAWYRPPSGVEKIMALVVSAIFCIYFQTNSDIEWSNYINSNSSRVETPKTVRLDVFDQCTLKVYDPFYKTIKKTVKYKEPLKNCNRNFTSPTQLIDGKVSMHPLRENEYDICSASCAEYVNPNKNKPSVWRNFTHGDELAMECDFVWTRCFKNNKNMDEFVHMQVHEPGSASPLPKPSRVIPNVFVIVIDSVSSTQALRSLPKTMDFLKRNMTAVVFHHLNRVGVNSRPNGYAFTLGWRIQEARRSVIGASDLPPQIDWNTVCKKYRDNDTTITNEYRDAGYKTALVEDWPSGDLYCYPTCVGTVKQHAMHSIRPLVNVLKQNAVKKNWRPQNCFEDAREMLNYTGMFAKAYKNQPKFALTWLATIAHGDANSLFHEDDYFEAFFKEHEPYFRDSFVFFMGDHGIRWGSSLETELGKREINNPFLIVTVPEFLRKNDKFMGTLEENSMKLVTQYDVHATLRDIVKFAPQSNFTDFTFQTILEDNPNNATSLIRPMGRFKKRNCKTIPVPFEYCLCEHEKEEVTSNQFKADAHKFVIDYANNLMKEHNASELCPELAADKVISMRAYVPEEQYGLYEMVFTAKPGGGKFKAYLRYDSETKLFSVPAKIERLNEYGKAGDCVKKDLDIVLFCNCIKK